jgi:hypothetical protein
VGQLVFDHGLDKAAGCIHEFVACR